MLKNPVWQVVGVIVGIAAIFVTIIVYNQEKPVKRLQVEILSNNPLVSISSEVTTDIQVLYKQQPVKSLSVILLKFSNIGNTPITESDYSEPITISLSPQAQVGEVTIQETSPAGIELTPTVLGGSEIGLRKSLLNPGDQVVIKILAINNDGTLSITGRIAGVKEIEVSPILGSGATNVRAQSNLIAGIIFGSIAAIIVWAFIWSRKPVIEWRRKHLGYDPAKDAYDVAYAKAYDSGGSFADMRYIVQWLDKALTYDPSYGQKAEEDPVFQRIREYEPFQDMLRKHKGAQPDSAEDSQNDAAR